MHLRWPNRLRSEPRHAGRRSVAVRPSCSRWQALSCSHSNVDFTLTDACHDGFRRAAFVIQMGRSSFKLAMINTTPSKTCI